MDWNYFIWSFGNACGLRGFFSFFLFSFGFEKGKDAPTRPSCFLLPNWEAAGSPDQLEQQTDPSVVHL